MTSQDQPPPGYTVTSCNTSGAWVWRHPTRGTSGKCVSPQQATRAAWLDHERVQYGDQADARKAD